MTITALPPAPSTSDPTNFAAKADALLAALATFVTEANALAVAMNLNATTDTSATSNSIATGAKTFTVTADKSFQPGMFLVIADTAAPSTNWMYGQVTSYSGTSLVMSITVTGGSGTKTAWTISQSAAYNIAGSLTQAFSALSLACAGPVTSSSATAGIGYSTGAGGTVTQLTNKNTAVTLNKACGQITMHNAALAANTSVPFSLNSTAIAANDFVGVCIKSGTAGNGTYIVSVDQVTAGLCSIHLRNVTAGSLSEAVVLNFVVIKAVTS